MLRAQRGSAGSLCLEELQGDYRDSPGEPLTTRNCWPRVTSSEWIERTGSGAGGQTRTDDLLITNQLLYQLSYAGNPLDSVANWGSRKYCQPSGPQRLAQTCAAAAEPRMTVSRSSSSRFLYCSPSRRPVRLPPRDRCQASVAVTTRSRRMASRCLGIVARRRASSSSGRCIHKDTEARAARRVSDRPHSVSPPRRRTGSVQGDCPRRSSARRLRGDQQ